MSMVVKAITATDTGDRKVVESFSPLFQDVFNVKQEIHETRHTGEVLKVYRIGVTLGNQCMVSKVEQLHYEDALTEAIKRTKRSVIEAIFGEFRQDIRHLENAIYDRDFAKARDALRQLEVKMFEDL